MDVPATMPTGEQVFLCQVKLIGFQVALQLGVNLNFPGVLLALGIDAAEQDFISNPSNSHHVRGE